MTSADSRDEAVPGVYPGPDADLGRLLYTFEVDGETFAVRARGDGFDYDWIAGGTRTMGSV